MGLTLNEVGRIAMPAGTCTVWLPRETPKGYCCRNKTFSRFQLGEMITILLCDPFFLENDGVYATTAAGKQSHQNVPERFLGVNVRCQNADYTAYSR